jgi:hypothetical protein
MFAGIDIVRNAIHKCVRRSSNPGRFSQDNLPTLTCKMLRDSLRTRTEALPFERQTAVCGNKPPTPRSTGHHRCPARTDYAPQTAADNAPSPHTPHSRCCNDPLKPSCGTPRGTPAPRMVDGFRGAGGQRWPTVLGSGVAIGRRVEGCVVAVGEGFHRRNSTGGNRGCACCTEAATNGGQARKESRQQ